MDHWVDSWSVCGKGDGLTFNSSHPTTRIDFLFYPKESPITCNNATVIDTTVSDHRPVLVEFDI